MVCRDSALGGLPYPFVMLNSFQHPWPDLPFYAVFQVRTDHGP